MSLLAPKNLSVRAGARRPTACAPHGGAFRAVRPHRALTAARAQQQEQQQRTASVDSEVSDEDEQRWEAQVAQGKVRNVVGADLQQYLSDGWLLLDVRPPTESKKARISGAIEVPVFLEDEEVSLSSFIKRASAFGMGGWWLGGSHMVPNDKFLSTVQAQVPKDARLVVGCQKGLRSLAACEQLSLAGYETLAWVNGGFDSCKSGQVPTEGDVDIRYAGIGGLSEAIGWTVVQQEQNKSLGSANGVLAVVGVILVADLMLFAGEYIQAFLQGKL